MAGQLISSEVCIAPFPRPLNHTSPACGAPLAEIAPPVAAPVASEPPITSGITSGITFGAALAQARRMPPTSLPFRAVNQRDTPGYDPGMQRHHLLPKQVLSARCFGHLFERIGRGRIGFDDFRSNGLLLPASDDSAVRIGLPMHRGPHRQYNAMVLERVGQVEASWSELRLRAPEIALDEALMRLRLLQAALRRRLLAPGIKRLSLNRFDPLGREADFSHMDAVVDALWPATEPAMADPKAELRGNAAELALIEPAQPHETEAEATLFGVQLAARAGRSAFAF